MDKKDLFFLNGLSKQLLKLFDFKTLNLTNTECSCEILINKENLNDNNKFDDGLLIALIDTFSSYAVKFLVPNANFQNYLSLNIQMISYEDIINNQKIRIEVELMQKFERDILLGIKVFKETGKLAKFITHLKRKISGKI